MSILDNLLHPVQAINNALLKNLIKQALEHLPELKQAGLNYLKDHKDEFLAKIKNAIVSAVRKFIESKAKEVKAKILEDTANPN